MAHTPAKRAKVLADVLGDGLTLGEAETKHGVPKGTISKWIKALKTKPATKPKRNETPLERAREVTPKEKQEQEFDQKFKRLLLASLDMTIAWAETCTQEDFIRSNPEGANELGRTVLERADRLVEVVRRNIDPPRG